MRPLIPEPNEMLNIGPQELLIILVIALLVVGPQRLPELGRSIGRGLRELRKAQDEVRRTIQVNLDEPNGDGGSRPAPRPGAESSPSTPAERSGSQDPTPTAGATPAADEVRDISRSLGRSLGQIRRAREEVQRSFRVDLDAPAPTSPRTDSRSATPSPNRGDATASGDGGPEPAPPSEATTQAPDPPDDPAAG